LVIGASASRNAWRQAGRPPHGARGDDVVEQHRVEAALGQIRVRVHVVVVRHGQDAVFRLRLEEHLVGLRAAERSDTPSAERGQPRVALPVGCADGEDFAEFEVGNRDSEQAAAGGPILDPAHADVEITAGDRGVDG
jgi:hypothetical protein